VADDTGHEEGMNDKLTDSRRIYDLEWPVGGAAYLELLQRASMLCSGGLVVIRASLSNVGLNFLDALSPFTTGIATRDEWPGTRLSRRSAEVREFVINEQSVELLRSRSTAVSDWYYPDLPEDLCLLRVDGTTWFQSTVHESWAALWQTNEEAASLERGSPNLSRLLGPPRNPK